MWPRYLGQYKSTEEEHEGAPVFHNGNGMYLYHHKKGQWRINNVINERGVFKGVQGRESLCLTPNLTWYYWDNEWQRGNIMVSCDEDSGMNEYGRLQSSFSLLPSSSYICHVINLFMICCFQELTII